MNQIRNIGYVLPLIVIIICGIEGRLMGQPVNDLPCNALEINVSESCEFFVYTNMDAGNSGIPNPGCGEYEGGDIWFFVVVPLSGILNIQTDSETESQFPDNDGWMYRGAMAHYTGRCDSLVLLNCNADNSSYNPRMAGATISEQAPGDTIWVRIWENSNNDNGMVKICASSQEQGECPSIFSVSGGGAFCQGDTGVAVSLSDSESGFYYTLIRNDSLVLDTLIGTGDSLIWSPINDPGIYQILAHHPVDTCFYLMNDSAEVVLLELPKLSFDAVSITCFEHGDGSIETSISDGTEPYQLLWTGPDGFASTQPSLENLEPGAYALTVTDFNLCTKAGPMISITQPALLEASIDQVTHLTGYEANDGAIQMTISGGTVPYQISWEGTDDYFSSDKDPIGMTVGTYEVMITDAHICQDSIKTIVVSLEEDAQEVFIPEGFSPNGDGYNDLFEILGIDAYPENELVVFNRQGVEVYHRNNYKNEWDGTPEKGGVLGGVLPEGTYYYVFTYGTSSVKKGYVYLNRE